MSHFAVTAVGQDRPGIVAAVTAVFVDQGCNLEDSSMTNLRGHFAIMLVVDAPPTVSQADLEGALAGPAAQFGLVVAVHPIAEVPPGPSPSAPTWTVAVYGADRPGIVHGVARLLADEGVNIVDLSTRVIGDPDRPVYAMILEVDLPPGVDADVLQSRLDGLAGELGVSCRLHRSEADIL